MNSVRSTLLMSLTPGHKELLLNLRLFKLFLLELNQPRSREDKGKPNLVRLIESASFVVK